ncbi:MAG TPA: MG2 domain-containing protein [Myxococcales bacterium]|jgi:uncharacterized protein YfaS (alpha-2-macroglobulin family)
MTCRDCAPLLLDYHFDTLDSFQRSGVEQHLRECEQCRATLERLNASVPDQLSWPDEEPPQGLAEKAASAVRAKVEAEARAEDDWTAQPNADVVPLRRPAPSAAAKRPASPLRTLMKIAAAIGIVSFGLWGWSVNQRRVSLMAALDGQQELAPGTLSTLRMSVFDVQTQEPISGAQLKVLLRGADGRETVIFEGQSDRWGTLSAGRKLPDLPEGGYSLIATATRGRESTTVTQNVTLARRYKVLLSTDKPTYQPGQTVHVRALARESTANKPPEGKELAFTVMDAKGNKVGRRIAKVDRFGSASFDFPLADEILLGTWKVEAALAGVTSDVDVTVARYTLPKFEVKLTSEKPWYKPGEVVSGRVESRYFFGKPVKNAKVKVTAGVFVDSFRTVASAEGIADESGIYGFELALPTSLPGLSFTQGSAAVDLKLEVLDQAGERVEKHQGLMVAAESMTVSAVPEGGVLVPGVENRVLVLAVRPDGEPVAGAKVSFPMAEGAPSGVTGEDGLAAISYVPTSPRRDLLVRVDAKDGGTLTRSLEVTSDTLPGVIRTERTIYSAGETVKGEVLASSPAGAAFLDVVRDGRTITTHTVPLTGGKGAFAIDLPAESAGTVTLYAYTPGKDTKRTRKTLFVGEPRSLKVAISADAETFRPGKEAKLTFKVEGEDGKPVSAGVGVAVVDESVFALAAKEPALLKAYFLLAEELSKPRYELDPARVVSDPTRDRAASLLFSQPRESEVQRVGATGEGELQTRRASLVATQTKASRTSWGFGLVFLGVLFEGAIRFFFEKLFGRFLKGKWWRSGALILGAGLGFAAKMEGADEVTAFLVGLIPVVIVLVIEGLVAVATRSAESGGPGLAEYTVIVGLILLSALAVITIFGQNLRALSAASSNALGGDEANANVAFAGSAGSNLSSKRKAIQNFGSNSQGDEDDNAHFPPPRPAEAKAAADPAKPGPKPATAAEKAKVRVRSWFPETMFWSPSVVTGADGLASVTMPVADSITRWRVSATASAADGRLGVGSGSLVVFQDFFVDVDLPVALTVGDEIEVPIAVHNYLPQAQKVKLEVEGADWFETLSPRVQEIELAADEVLGVPLKLRAKAFGKKTLTVYAFGSKLNDALRREIEVRPDGVPGESAVGGALGSKTQTVTATLPKGAIPGSEKVLLRVYPGLFAAALEGLEGVLQMPSGCFEQTSSATFPNVLVLDYLRRTKSAKPDVEARAIEYIQLGYQRLLSFEVKGGGFEWFGRAPANQILTAYGLLEFADMARVYEVDPAVLRRTQEWLISRQGIDGSWQPDSQSLSDGLYRNDFHGKLGATAYVAWALAESGYRGPALDSAMSFLASRSREAEGAYVTALVANTLLLGGRDGASAEALDRLEKSSARDGERARFSAGARTAMYSAGNSADAETTALAAMALARSGRATLVKPALDWLLSARDPRGAWGSTQATVLVLRTLLSAQATGPDAQAAGEVLIAANGEAVAKVLIKPETSDLVQTVDLTRHAKPGKPLTVDVTMAGTARAQFQLVTKAWVPKPGKEEALSIKMAYDRVTLAPDDTITARATATWNRPGPSGMVMLALGVPPGFEVDSSSVGKLVAQGKVGKFTLTGKELLLYVDQLKTKVPAEYPYQLRAKFPVRAKAPAAQAYLYYQPEVKAEAGPIALVVRRK